jgi:uncharacterized protein
MRSYEEIEKYVLGKLKKELAPNLSYHGIHHTLAVLNSVELIGRAEKVTDAEMILLKVAVLFHDVGFTIAYRNHEEAGCDMVRRDLPGYGFSQKDIDTICGMVMATKIPQKPLNKLEEIIADADLEYLGTDNFEEIAATLYAEVKIYLNIESERQWNIIQMNFLRGHHYFTDYCKKNREPTKQKHLKKIIKIVESYH